jgi:hypothetical protein
MAVLNDSLSVWEIGFRWVGYDPGRLWIWIPLPVRDNFRMLMDAILQGHLYCDTLGLEKHSPIYADLPQMGIRYWLDDVNAAIEGQSFNRKLLKWAVVERWSMQRWCERRGIPLPEFWFPPGWNLDYEWPDDSEPDEAVSSPVADNGGSEDTAASPELVPTPDPGPEPTPQAEAMLPPADEREAAGKRALARSQRAKIACQEVARRLWAKQPTATKKSIAASAEVQEIAPGSDFEFEVVERWLSEVDPRNPDHKRGPKKKQTGGGKG